MAAAWVAAVIVVSVQATIQHNNNFEIFRTSWDNLLAGRDLYAASERHRDFFKYSPSFPVLFAPFAILPFGGGMLLWNALNAGLLYWGLGRVLSAQGALAARTIVLMDTVGAMQNVQSNALVAGLMIVAFGELRRRHEARAAVALVCGALVKIFPIIAVAFALFQPRRLPRFALWSIVVAALLLAAPLLFVTPAQLALEYQSWLRIQRIDALDRGYSVMQQLHLWLGVDWPNLPVQLAGAAILLAPLARREMWDDERFRLYFLASVLMFSLLFNHKAESPTFVIAVSGVAIWFALSSRTRLDWIVLAIVVVGTILPSSDVMPVKLQQDLFDPYRLKTLPVLLVWVLTQAALWREKKSAPPPARESSAAVRAA